MSDGGKQEKPQPRPPAAAPADAQAVVPRRAAGLPAILDERRDTADKALYRFSDGQQGTPPLANLQAERTAPIRAAAARIMRKAAGGAPGGAAKIPESGGAPLAGDLRQKLEPKLGADLSAVRVHTGGDSAAAASQYGARAFTLGNDVHFNQGEFKPGTKEGDRLLGHELTHVVQGQNTGAIHRKADDAKGGEGEPEAGGSEAGEHDVSQPHEPAEQEADAMGDHVADALHDGKGKKSDKGKGGAKGKSGGNDDGEKPGEVSEKAPPKIAAKLDGVGRKINGLPPLKLFRKTPKEQAEALEKRDGGHSLARHGPDVSDKQLQDRLTTGVAPDGEFSPTDVSTKFASHEMYLETREKATTTLDGAIAQTSAKISPLIKTMQKAEADHKKAPPGPEKGPAGKWGLALANAKKAITDACGAPAANEVKTKATLTDSAVPVTLAKRYVVVVEHAKPIGSGFEGDGPTKPVTEPNPKPGKTPKTGTGFTGTKAIPKVTRSETTFEVGGVGSLINPPKAADLKVAQHFPTTKPAGIQ